MAFKDSLILFFLHPLEFRTLLQFKLYHNEDKRSLSHSSQVAATGWDRETMRRCWDFLDLTSRSFSAVIKELDGDLARVICLFYLVLRGLDTIEDDMTIPDAVKDPLLRTFHVKTVTPGWNYDGCGPDEKDRQLLVEYQNVTAELNILDPRYREIIVDICQKMEVGMADYAHKAATTGSIYIEKVEEYDLYCHYVAGLVGEGCSRLFAASGREAEWMAEQLELSNHMGLLLQKTNIIRDVREDTDTRRHFWPREIWGKQGFKEMSDMTAHGGNEALWALSGMVADALRHAPDALDYLRLLKNQTTFNFCAIPQSMAMATLNLVFMNPEVFQRNIKIRKAEAAALIMKSTNARDVAYTFRSYARKIHHKSVPEDPNFLRISVACGMIEQWCEMNYPSFVVLKDSATGGKEPGFDGGDARSRIIQMEFKQDQDADLVRRGLGLPGQVIRPGAETTQKEIMGLAIAAFVVILVFSLSCVYFALWLVKFFEL